MTSRKIVGDLSIKIRIPSEYLPDNGITPDGRLRGVERAVRDAIQSGGMEVERVIVNGTPEVINQD